MSEELTVSKTRLRLSYDYSGVNAEMITPASEPVNEETDSTPILTTEMRKKRKKANTSRHDETKMYNTMADTVRPHGTGTTRVSEPSSPPKKGGTAPNFRPMYAVAKRLDGLRCHLVRR